MAAESLEITMGYRVDGKIYVTCSKCKTNKRNTITSQQALDHLNLHKDVPQVRDYLKGVGCLNG